MRTAARTWGDFAGLKLGENLGTALAALPESKHSASTVPRQAKKMKKEEDLSR
jgi:hypothetical protein